MPLTPDEETDHILRVYDGKMPDILALLERQFNVLHARAQVLLTLAGIVITTTGFSGRVIAGTNRAGQLLIIAGITVTLLSAAVVVHGALHLNWITRQLEDAPRAFLHRAIRYRDWKTAAYRRGVHLLILGLALYVAAIAVMLLNPHEFNLPAK